MNLFNVMSLLLSTVFTVWTFNVAHALEVSTELGFKKISDSSTPAAVKQASAAVFEVRIYADDKIEDLKIVDLSDPKMKDLESKIRAIDQFDEKEKTLILRQIKNCRTHGMEKQCALFFTIEKATGFIAGDGATFWTNAHVINRYIKLQASISGKTQEEVLKSNPRLPLFLFNQEGDLVFDPMSDTAHLVDYDSPSTAAALSSSWYAEDTDFVKIKLSKAIAEPLKFGSKPASNEKLFRPGFAACTGCTANLKTTDPLLNLTRGAGKDSTGQGMWWTAGLSLSKEQAASFYGVSESFFQSYKANQMLFFAADAQVGFSGGPILNSLGEVVGIFAGSKPKTDKNGTMIVLSRGVRPPEFNR